jgi:hypothetical protein
MGIPPEEIVVSYSSLGLYPLLSRGATCLLLISPLFWAKSWELFETKRALLAAAQACFERFNQCPEKILSVIGSKAAKVA